MLFSAFTGIPYNLISQRYRLIGLYNENVYFVSSLYRKYVHTKSHMFLLFVWNLYDVMLFDYIQLGGHLKVHKKLKLQWKGWTVLKQYERTNEIYRNKSD